MEADRNERQGGRTDRTGAAVACPGGREDGGRRDGGRIFLEGDGEDRSSTDAAPSPRGAAVSGAGAGGPWRPPAVSFS